MKKVADVENNHLPRRSQSHVNRATKRAAKGDLEIHQLKMTVILGVYIHRKCLQFLKACEGLEVQPKQGLPAL